MIRVLALLCPFYLLAADNSIRGFPPNSVSTEQSWEAKAQATPDPQRVRNTMQVTHVEQFFQFFDTVAAAENGAAAN